MIARALSASVVLALLTAACGGSDDAGVVHLYTSVTQETVDAVVAGFEAAHPDVRVEVYRAPTGELNARIAAEQRDGSVHADVLWLTDPLSMQAYDAAGSLRAWHPAGADSIPDDFKADTFWGTRVLNLVIVAGAAVDPPPAGWDDLVATAAAGGVAIPDPGLAGSAFAALAYFALTPDYGMEYLRSLHGAGATQVGTPGDVITGVAEGQYAAGITLDYSARGAVAKGSPITEIWPDFGAITLYSPIAVWTDSTAAGAEAFVEYVIGEQGQSTIAGTGWEPADDDIPWETAGPQVTLDWTLAFDRQQELLDEYRAIFGG